jgi:hemerythrin-like metal-binding protein
MSSIVSVESPVPLSDTELAYDRFVPRQFLELLGRPSIVDVKLGDNVEKEMTLLFSDIRDFTLLSESILPAENFRFINSYLSTMEPVVGRHRGIVDKFIGDGIMAMFPACADDGVRAGIDMLRQLVIYNRGRNQAGYVPIRIGIGIHSGLVMMGTIGGHGRMDSTVIGDAVNLASRLEEATKVYGAPLIISEQTLQALEDPAAYCYRFLDRVQVKGRYQSQAIYEVYDADPEPLWAAKQQTQEVYDEALAYFHMGRPDRARPLLEECLRKAPDDKVVRSYLARAIDAEKTGGTVSTYSPQEQIAWLKEYSIRISEIDNQHQEMLEMLALLAEQVQSGDALAVGVEATLDALALHVAEHFSAEENLMWRYDYPFMADHVNQHAAFMKAFEALRKEILEQRRDPLYLLFRIQIQLVDWQIAHSTKSDYHLGHFLVRAGLN